MKQILVNVVQYASSKSDNGASFEQKCLFPDEKGLENFVNGYKEKNPFCKVAKILDNVGHIILDYDDEYFQHWTCVELS